MPTHDKPVLTHLGVSGVLVQFGGQMSEASNRAALAFHAAMEELPLDGVLESAPSLTSVFLRIDLASEGTSTVEAQIIKRMRSCDWSEVVPQSRRRHWTIPCCFDGPQLSEAAELAGVSETRAIQDITGSTLKVLTLGFAPGQPYMGLLPQDWNIPRMQGVAPQVPQGAVVVAVRQAIIFANASPTGWRHIGDSAFRCFDATRSAPFALRPGDTVQFSTAGRGEIDALRDAADGLGGAILDETDE